MQLSPAQKATFLGWLNANAAALSDDAAAGLANTNAAPSYAAWKTMLSRHDLTDQPDTDTDGVTVTNFTWSGATGGYISRSQGERDAFAALFNQSDTVKPSLANVRSAFDDIFSGAGAGAIGNRTHFKMRGQRRVTNFEKLYLIITVGGPTQTGARGAKTNPDTFGTGSTGQPIDYLVTGQDVSDIRGGL